ncbi:MYCBP-associated protein-like [Zerene cesonia]|uniref:MYCBP-associated protein-like n=1 Tax=Zerene cesonia TaxID=33412 RepID=UPI0018E52A4B|nr:MYCBP-associated protein-like [Zerene cesonia]
MKKSDNEKKFKEITIYPDRELLVWEKWIQIRKEETQHLAAKTNRPPVDLAMNLLEKVREDKERKEVLEHAQIETKPTVRGRLWEQPLRLKQRCYCEPVYEVQRTRAEMGKPRIIQHIGVPKYIQETEKGISGVSEKKSCSNIDHEYKKYRDEREKTLKEKIDKIDPYRPEIKDLFILGSKPKPPPPKIPDLPKIILSTVMSHGNSAVSSIYALKVNNTIFVKDIPDQKIPSALKAMQKELSHEWCNTWSYYFNTPVNRAGRCKLFLKNVGTVMLRYCWKKIKRSLPFIPEQPFEQVFFFNKNEDTIYPGQEKIIFFTFISDKPGIYSEIWELSTCNICLFDTIAEKIIINLNADSVENIERTRRKAYKLDVKIKHVAIRNYILHLLHEVVTNATCIQPQPYPYKKYLLERELFIMKNPIYYYHQTEVLHLHDLYTEMLPGESWDLSIVSWRAAMMEKMYDDRMKYFELLKKSHLHLLKPWFEGEELLKEKYRAVNLLLGQLADKFDSEYLKLYELMRRDVPGEAHVSAMSTLSIASLDSDISSTIRNILYVRMYEHLAFTIEMCAGVLSGLDLNRWIQFDFCR